MQLTIKLAVRNLWRNKRRSFITFLALSVGIVMLIVLNSISSGFGHMAFQNIIQFETGDIQIHAPEYFNDRELLPLDYTVEAKSIIDALHNTPGIVASTPRIKTSARLHVGWEEFPVIAIGMDPSTDPNVFELPTYVDGRLPKPGHAEGTIGAGLAKLLDIHLGDFILLITRTRDHALEALDVEVVGIVRSPNPTVNETHVYVPIDFIQSELALGDRVTEIILRTATGHDVDAALHHVQDALTAARIVAEPVTWKESAEDLINAMQADAASNLMLTGVILLIALVGVTNTILLGVLERKQEIGTMKAMGMREGEIVRLFLLEAGAIGLIAVFIGVAVGSVLNLFLVNVGIDFTDMLSDINLGMPIAGRIYGVWNSSVIIWAVCSGMITSLVAGYLPARHGAKQEAALAVRE